MITPKLYNIYINSLKIVKEKYSNIYLHSCNLIYTLLPLKLKFLVVLTLHQTLHR